MQTIAILCLIFGLLQVNGRAVDSTTELSSEEEACVNDLHLDKAKIQTQNSLDIAPENDADFGKFLSCFYKKMGWQDSKTGVLIFDELNTALLDAAVSEIEDEDPMVKMMVRYMMQAVFTECENGLSKTLSPEASVVKLQNCIVNSLNAMTVAK